MKTAIFGGTFDPIHNAHLEIARQAADQFHLDRVVFIPAGAPPHKSAGTLYAHRLAMVELACATDARFEVSRIEQDTGLKSYTIDTLERLTRRGERPDYLIIGADAFAEIETWHRWKDVIAAVEFIVVARPGHAIAVPSHARVRTLESLALRVSSSDIRRRLALGETPAELPAAVVSYIQAHRLYRA